MVNNRSNVLMITEEDIEQLLSEWANVPAWVKAHVIAKCPAHRYEGELLIDGENLLFDGRDIKEGRVFGLKIPLDNITDVNVGFSEDLKASSDPAFGIGGPVPFVVRYQNNGKSQTAYFNTSDDNYPPHINVNNIKWYEMLDEIVAKSERLELDSRRNRHLVTAW